MSQRQVGIWFIGAFGGVASTATLGLAALKRGLRNEVGMVTGLPGFANLDLDQPGRFVVGGHDIRQGNYRDSVNDLHRRSNVFDHDLIQACGPDLDAWSKNVRPGTVYNAGETIEELADLPTVHRTGNTLAAIAQIKKDLQEFRSA